MKYRQKQQGLSLVELLIATALGLLLITGLFTIYLGNKKTYQYNEALAHIQENGRIAMLRLNQDVRMASTIQTIPDNNALLIQQHSTQTPAPKIQYYVADTKRKNQQGDAIFALYRHDLTGPATVASELVEGVENMQIYYYTKDDPTHEYLGNEIPKGADIVGVKIALLLDSVDAGNDQPQTYTFLEKTYTSTDRCLHREWDTVIALREHLP